ncbi:MAG: carboxypeptidase M32 [Actinomycetota bacterium]|nr:carboxypeptidase M32 [Actinomycetota bacterium]
MDAWERLVARLAEMADLRHARNLAHWDLDIMMPPGGAASRARMVATLEGLLHERFTDPQLGDLIAELESQDSDDIERTASVRVLRREYDKATKVPIALVKELAEVTSNSYPVWFEAKTAANFALFEPHLKRIVALKKDYADALGYKTERYEVLLDDYEPDMPPIVVENLFDELALGLAPIFEQVTQRVGARPAWRHRDYDDAKRVEFCTWLAQHVGFDMRTGRLDTSPHPSTIRVGIGDVRQTVERGGGSVTDAVFTTLHETGHALYDQGMPNTDLPIGDSPSMGMHESQSRLWENHVGRSRAFCEFVLPHLQARFPELDDLSSDDFYRGVNRPERSLIRVRADELTYPLHVIVRFQLELALFRDELDVADVRDAWDSAYEKHLGIRPANDAEGVLQDMHWAIGYLGYFPTYTLGTLYAAAFYRKAEEELGDLTDELRKGETTRLLEWLRAKIHSKGYLKPASDLARDVLGTDLSAQPFLDHVKTRYGELYGIEL